MLYGNEAITFWIFMTSRTEGNIDTVVDEILDYQVDGSLPPLWRCPQTYLRAASGRSIVLFNRTQDGDALSDVTTDNYDGGKMVAEFLVAAGHRKTDYIAKGHRPNDREAGFVTQSKVVPSCARW